MKALILSDYKQLDIVELAKPQPVHDELLIQIKACGICGSDVHGYEGSTGRRPIRSLESRRTSSC